MLGVSRARESYRESDETPLDGHELQVCNLPAQSVRTRSSKRWHMEKPNDLTSGEINHRLLSLAESSEAHRSSRLSSS